MVVEEAEVAMKVLNGGLDKPFLGKPPHQTA